MKSILSTVLLYLVEYYTANCVSWIPRLTLLDLQIGLMNAFLEWNFFVHRVLTIVFPFPLGWENPCFSMKNQEEKCWKELSSHSKERGMSL